MRAIDLFCGAGGASQGMVEAGLDVVAGVDNDETALRTYNEAFDHPGINHNLHAIDLTKFPFESDDVEWVHGSTPCKGLSTAQGSRSVEDRRNELVWSFIDWIDALDPMVVTFENVTGIQTISDEWMERMEDEFAVSGYEMRWEVLNAAEHGVPQRRKRVFCVAIDEDVAESIVGRWFPPVMYLEDDQKGSLEVLWDLYTPPTSSEVEDSVEGYVGFDTYNHVAIDHVDCVRERFANTEPGWCGSSVTKRRLHPKEPSPTITVSSGTPPIHPTEPRRLTVRECARLQSFPDDHVFYGSKSEQYSQVGNAVPPKLMCELASHVHATIERNTAAVSTPTVAADGGVSDE